jgi:hypothetical protein
MEAFSSLIVSLTACDWAVLSAALAYSTSAILAHMAAWLSA